VAVPAAVILPAVALKVAEVAPAPIDTDGGTDSAVTLLPRPTVAPPVLETVTVQTLDPPDPTMGGEQTSEVTVMADASPIDVVCEEPFSDAVTMAVCAVVIVPAVALKLAEVAAAPTDTVFGTGSPVTLLLRLIVAPPGLETVTVQTLDPPDPKLVGLQTSDVTVTAGDSPIDAVCEEPFSDAVTVAVCAVVIVPAVAVKVAEVTPAPMETDCGTVNARTLLAKVTVAPPVLDTVTVQTLDPPVVSGPGVQVSPTAVGGVSELTDPPLPATIRLWPAAVAPMAFATAIAALAAPGATVRLTVATTPF
jgi:hypothetical protein